MDRKSKRIYDAYTDIIKEAMEDMDRKTGSTKGEIISYMTAVVKRHIDDLTVKREILKIGDAYIHVSNLRKSDDLMVQESIEGSIGAEKERWRSEKRAGTIFESAKRRRGRPRKQENSNIVLESGKGPDHVMLQETMEGSIDVEKQRPKSKKKPETMLESAKRRRGRPPKEENSNAVPESGKGRRRRLREEEDSNIAYKAQNPRQLRQHNPKKNIGKHGVNAGQPPKKAAAKIGRMKDMRRSGRIAKARFLRRLRSCEEIVLAERPVVVIDR